VLPDVISIQATGEDDDHAHSRAAVTFTSPVPPDGVKLDGEFAIESWQRLAVGPVTFVTAELPHPDDALVVMAANSRDRVKRFTAARNTSRAPATMEPDVSRDL
jgi:hypothetical protein